ncbi:pullulanase [Bacilli bacterium]|nr:pullulanase [Bacilli bacterium]GHU39996.1 pullulanase [Bacilli bacterium]
MVNQFKKINRKIKIAAISLLSLGLLGTFSGVQPHVPIASPFPAEFSLGHANAATLSNTYATAANADLKTATASNYFAPFDAKWAYTADDLGANYTTSGTTLKVWAPTATGVKVISYGKSGSNATAPQVATYTMTRGTVANPSDLTKNTIGVWAVTMPGDQNGLVYTYQLTFGNGTISDHAGNYGAVNGTSTTMTTQDPYSIATVSGGLRSVVVSPASVTPSGFAVKQGTEATWRQANSTQAVIDEIHIKNFTNSPTSGVTPAYSGKFLGVAQTETTNPNTGLTTGLSYEKALGVNYLQILPMYDFASISDTGLASPTFPSVYNWGYDPLNYNVPEGSYATSVTNPNTRLNEMKTMVQAIHNQGMGVVMDVVYNHVYDQATSSFEKTQPGYYFRRSSTTGCGNDTATNHLMFRQFILNSIKYYTLNYGMDGYRFDIMASFDKDTMNAIRAMLNTIDPHILTYGEGWYMGTDVPDGQKVDVSKAVQTPGIGYFNNGERDTIQNFVAGDQNSSGLLLSAIRGSGDGLMQYGTPAQAVNYVECHDGQTISDLEWLYNPYDAQETHEARSELASAINILAAGTTVMQNGQEFNMSRYVNVSGNSALATIQQAKIESNHDTGLKDIADAQIELARNPYNGVVTLNNTKYFVGDESSNTNWDLASTYAAQVDFLRQLIHFKKANPSFWPDDYSQIYNGTLIQPLRYDSGIVSYIMANGVNKYLVIINASGGSLNFTANDTYYGNSLADKNILLSSDSHLASGTSLSQAWSLGNYSLALIQLQ